VSGTCWDKALEKMQHEASSSQSGTVLALGSIWGLPLIRVSVCTHLLVWSNPADLVLWDHRRVQADTKSCCCCGQEHKYTFTRDSAGLSHRKRTFWQEGLELRSVRAVGKFYSGAGSGGSKVVLAFRLVLSYQVCWELRHKNALRLPVSWYLH